MPYYDLKCKRCETVFQQKATIAERSEGKIYCPECGSNELDAVYKASPNVLLKKTPEPAGCPHAARCGSACPHAHG